MLEGCRLDPDGIIGIFHLYNPSSCTIALSFDAASNRNDYHIFLAE
jgi:hypothetical protein